ncbi:hypothetical protein AB6E77_18605 [Vibrio sp. 10N.247.311.18]|uniref:hypothetical protein n=1 Tax=unclassified Vibrio TaxID=2614977 RepID=UPI00354EAE19
MIDKLKRVSLILLFSRLPFSFILFLCVNIIGLGSRFRFTKFNVLDVTTYLFFVTCFFVSSINYIIHDTSIISLLVPSVFLVFLICVNTINVSFDRLLCDTIIISGGVVLVTALIEIMFSFNFASYLYAGNEHVRYLETDRFLVSGLFANYNDFSFSMFFFIATLSSYSIKSKSIGVKVSGFIAITLSLSICIYLGSRGFLLSILAFYGLVIYLKLPNKFFRILMISIGIIGLFSSSIILSSYLLDNSNMIRISIIENYINLISNDWYYLLFGFSEKYNYVSHSVILYGEGLYDPHNLFMEVMIMYGVPAFLLLLFSYIMAIVNLIKFSEDKFRGGYEAVLIPVFVLCPLIGAVPSSSLMYYYLQFILIAMLVIYPKLRKDTGDL